MTPAPTPRDLDRLSKDELVTLLHGALARLTVDDEAPAPRPRVARDDFASARTIPTATPRDVPQDWSKEVRKCPKCGRVGPVDPNFGVKVVRGIVRAQSWCKSCRATTNYYSAPRKHRTRLTKS